MTRIWQGMGATGAALIAVLMLSYAFVQSTVMQAAAAAPAAAPICGMSDLAGVGPAVADAGKAVGHAVHHAPCPFCSAAANPPLAGAIILAPLPSTFVFVTFLALQVRGPRGPPASEARARGPPIAHATA